MKCTCLAKYLHTEDVTSHSKIFHFKVTVKPLSASDEGKASAFNKKKAATPARKREKGSSDSPTYSHWLMKSEPESRFQNGIDLKFGIEDLKAQPEQTACWDGVRNYQARNFMRQMKVGQRAFFYHSNCKEPGVAGLMKVRRIPTMMQPATQAAPSGVDVQYQRTTGRFLPLSELKRYHLQHRDSGGPLKNLALFTKPRLSVQPLTAEEFDFILSLEDKKPL
uniref:Thymocyte nuclear protein 1 n=1 Tax=Oryzias sinensis TaxID=183150 RepID=A0A8C7WMS8_9TELE